MAWHTRAVRTLFFPQPPAVEVRIAGPMGLGVFATRAILKGERILEEDPVFVRPWRDMTVNTPPLADIVMDVCDMFVAQGLHEGRLRQMEELHYDPHIAEDERIVGPARRFLVERVNPTLAGAGLQGDNLEYNATRLAKLYAIQHSSGYTPDKVWGTDILSGVFPVYARINHSCIPNARPEYSFAHKRLEVYANRDIQPGEQIFRTYVELMGRNTEERGQELDDDYGIDECFCAMCENPETDELQTQIYKMYYGSFLYVFPNEIDDDDLTMEIEVAEDEDQCLEMAEKALELMTHPDIDLRDEWPRNMFVKILSPTRLVPASPRRNDTTVQADKLVQQVPCVRNGV